MKYFADAKATVERIRRQEMKASKEEAAKEKKIQQKQDKDRGREAETSLLAAAAAAAAAGNDEEKRGSEDANDATAAGEKENALLSVAGILIPKLKKKSKRQMNSRLSIN